MARRFDKITDIYEQECKRITSNAQSWTEFLKSACWNYKLRFDEILVLAAQRPNARAVCELKTWNKRFGRWVNKGAKSLAVFKEITRTKQELVYYFDIADTHEGRFAKSVKIWSMKSEYENNVINTLSNIFGELENSNSLAAAIISSANNDINDQFKDMSEPLKKLLANSAAYMIMSRMDINPDDYYKAEDFELIKEYGNDKELNLLGITVLDTVKKGLREVSRTIFALDEKNTNKEKENSYGRTEDKLQMGRGLFSTGLGFAGTTGGRIEPLGADARRISEEQRGYQSESILHNTDDTGTTDRVFSRSGQESNRNGRNADEADGGTGRLDGELESVGYDGLGTRNEQSEKPSTGNSESGSNFRLEYYDRDNEDKSLPFFGHDETIREMLRTTSHLKATKAEICDFYETHPDNAERTEYIKSIFNNDYTELLIGENQDHRVGYKTMQNVLHLWDGSYLSRTAQSFYDWQVIAQYFEAMRLLGELENTTTPLKSSIGEQISFIDEKAEDKSSAFSQEIIDAVLSRGSGISEGKMRIYEQFQKSLSIKENADFLKNEYGWGGSYPVITGAGIDENHDGKGILISKGIGSDKPHINLSWAQVEKRIGELISLDRYLNLKEKEAYPLWLEAQEERRAKISEHNENRNILNTAPLITNTELESKEEKEEDIIGKEISIDDSNFVIESIEKVSGNVSMRDVTFENRTGFPIYRSEKLEFVSKLIDSQDKEIPQNYKITEEATSIFNINDKFNGNLAAIKLLHKLQSEDRNASADEQKILAGYVGFGGLSKVFKEDNQHYTELKNELTNDEYNAARESTLTAFFTPKSVVDAMYKAMNNFGFKSGNILEPSCGVGNFIGLLPNEMQNSKFYGVELDSLSAGIAQKLYPNSNIVNTGFEKSEFEDNFFDVAIGNVPFGQFKVADKRYDKHNFLIHDYFFAKTIDKVRAGGIIALLTSKGTLDKKDTSVRKYIAQRAELLGAIRLPNNTFKGNAGTEAVSDIIFLKKRDNIIDIEPNWVSLGKVNDEYEINNYFVENPNMILGELKVVSGQFGPELTCEASKDSNFEALLNTAVDNIVGQIEKYDISDIAEEDNSIPANSDVKNFSYTLSDGKVYYRENSRMYPPKKNLSEKDTNRIKGLIEIRDSVRKLITLQANCFSDDEISEQMQQLNELYDRFIDKYGIIHGKANSIFSDDSSFPLLCALEIINDKGELERKADIFTKRTIRPTRNIESVDTASEALAISISEKSTVDLEFMQKLSGIEKDKLISELYGLIFKVPGDSEEYQTSDEYLSGNIRKKLNFAKLFAEKDETYNINVNALENAMPAELTAMDIDVRLGATWIPKEIVSEFVYQTLDTPRYIQYNIKIEFAKGTSEWYISNKNSDKANIKAYNTYGTSRINAYEIIESSLNLRTVRIMDYVDDGSGNQKPVLNQKETIIAQGKQELLKEAFKEWIWQEPQRRAKLVKLYNEKFNSVKPREYNGSHIAFVGMNSEISLREHQKNAVARILYGGNTLLAHVVGAGKTYTMAAAAMESKRLGLCNKPLFVVPNHLTEQWAVEFMQLYPAANILVATKKDFETKNRKKFCGRIATGEYDAIIIGHSQFEKIPMSIEWQQKSINMQIDEITTQITSLKSGYLRHNNDFTVKQLEKTRKNLSTKLNKLNDQSRKDDVVTFEELGVDRIFVDEAHNFKNLFLYTKMRNVAGISQTESQKSSDLYMKCRYLDALTNSKGTIFATGTPISNSMTEMYTMQRYLQNNLLSENDLQNFDSWASTFGETVSSMELAPEGTGYRQRTRFANFFNLPELMSLFRETADIQTADMLNLPTPTAKYNNIVIAPSEIQKEMVSALAERAEAVRSGIVNPNIDNMLKITNDGRKLALDQRLMNSLLPDNENSKVSVCANKVFEIWEKTEEQRLTQLVFCDISTPSDNFNVYDDIKKKLIAKGIPDNEIAYIHNAKTEVQKSELFKKVRAGAVRVLLGSSSKMGAGTNVQDRLIALHNLDCPWRPSDLEQRAGRIVRQGNKNKEVEIYRYVTEGTFDAYLYQLVENKQRFISQIMTSKCPQRKATDIDEASLSYAEIKALATGNPYIIEKSNLDSDVSRLKLMRGSYMTQIYQLQDKINKDYPEEIKRYEEKIQALNEDISRRITPPNGEFNGITIKGKYYDNKVEAGKAILYACSDMQKTNTILLGSYRGFDMKLYFAPFDNNFIIDVKGAASHITPLGTDAIGNITRLDNEINSIEKRLENAILHRDDITNQLLTAQENVKKPFSKEEELQTKTARLKELNKLLNTDKVENEIVFDEYKSKDDVCQKEKVSISNETR